MKIIKQTIVASALLLTITTACADKKPKLEDDYYKSVNYEWLNSVKIPKSKTLTSSFVEISNKIEQDLKNIAEKQDPKSISEKQVKNLYSSFIDKKTRNNLGIKPIKSYLDKIENAKTHKEIALLAAELSKADISSPFKIHVDVDLKNSDIYVLTMYESGISLSKDNYLEDNANSKKQIKAYKESLKSLFKLSGYKDLDKRVENVISIEKSLAKMHFTPVQNRNFQELYNEYDYKGVLEVMNNYPLSETFDILGVSFDRIIVQQLPYIRWFNKYFTEVSIEKWKDYYTAKVIKKFSFSLTEEFEKVMITYDKQRGEIQEAPKDWEQGIALIQTVIPQIVGRAYVENNFDEKSKKYVEKLVSSITEEFRLSITNSTIFTDETKAKALNKLDKMLYSIGYPEKWIDFSKLEIKPNELVENIIRVNNFNFARNILKLNQKVDKSSPEVSTHEVNASYQPTFNRFILLAGILNAPFFDINATDAQNYAGIGAVIAHEIGHAFDDQGSQFDADGNLRNWWTEKDKKAFNKLKNKLISQANNFEVFPGVYLKGELTIGEIIGDLNGFQISLKAYSRLRKKEGEIVNSKQFFEQYAKIWRLKARKEFMLKMIATDPHPISIFRTNSTLMNTDAFYDTYNIKEGDKMYRKPSERVSSMW